MSSPILLQEEAGKKKDLVCSVFVRYPDRGGELPSKTMKNSQTLQALKLALSEQAPLRARKSLGNLPGSPSGGDSSIPLHAGQMVEVLGEGRWSYTVGFLAGILKERPMVRVAWLNVEGLPLLPMALEQEGVPLLQLLFLERVPVGESVDILLVILRSGLFEWVVFDQALLPRIKRDAQVRKLQLQAEEHGSGILLLSERETPSFGVQVRVETGGLRGVRVGKVKGMIKGGLETS
ncbi:MAG: hypothetical protein EBX52_03510 [Proteobacteria bacterium]|nr:hypothetical protein [Pseudomonadota bacterium]